MWVVFLATIGFLAGVAQFCGPADGALAASSGGASTATFGVGGSCTGGEICPTTPSDLGSITAGSDLTVVYTAPSAHCSDVAVKLFEDGHPVGETPFVSPAQTSASVLVPWTNDGVAHELAFEGVGRVGGCNGGNLVSWGGTLTVTYERVIACPTGKAADPSHPVAGQPVAIAAFKPPCPEVPAVVSTPQQKQALKDEAALATASSKGREGAGVVAMTLGTCAVGAGVAIAIAGAPVIGASLAVVSFFMAIGGAWSYTQGVEDDVNAGYLLNEAEKDPPAGNYTQVARPASIRPPSIPVPAKYPLLDPALRDANLVLANAGQLRAVIGAEVTALDRSSGALRAKNRAAYERQKVAIATYLGDESQLLMKGIALRQQLAAAFSALNIDVSVSHQTMLAVAKFIRRRGLQKSTGPNLNADGLSLKSAGLSPSQTGLVVRKLSARGSSFDLASMFRDDPAADAADLRLASLETAAAVNVRRLP